MQTLMRVVDNEWEACPIVLALLLADVVDPPHGDRFFARLIDYGSSPDIIWHTLIAGATCAGACQRAGHLPTMNDLHHPIVHTWKKRTFMIPSLIPLVAIGRERDLLLPALDAVHGTDLWTRMIFDCLDAIDTLALMGGDLQALHTVLLDVRTMRPAPIAPWIIARLAASPDGHQMLGPLRGVNTPPP